MDIRKPQILIKDTLNFLDIGSRPIPNIDNVTYPIAWRGSGKQTYIEPFWFSYIYD